MSRTNQEKRRPWYQGWQIGHFLNQTFHKVWSYWTHLGLCNISCFVSQTILTMYLILMNPRCLFFNPAVAENLAIKEHNLTPVLGSRDGRFGSKMGQIGPKWDKSGAFLDQISVHLARGAKCTEIWSEKATDLSHLGPIWPTFEPNLPYLLGSGSGVC